MLVTSSFRAVFDPSSMFLKALYKFRKSLESGWILTVDLSAAMSIPFPYQRDCCVNVCERPSHEIRQRYATGYCDPHKCIP